MMLDTHLYDEVTAALDAAGLDLPDEVAAALAQIDALRDLRETPANPRTLATAVAGKTPAATVKIIRDAAATADKTRATANVAGNVVKVLRGSLIGLVRDQADDLIRQYRPRFDQAARAITDAIDAGLTPDMTADEAIDRGHAEVYMRLRDSTSTLDVGVQLSKVLYPREPRTSREVIGQAPDSYEQARWITPDGVQPDGMQRGDFGGKPVGLSTLDTRDALTYFGAVTAGFTLRLNTHDEIAEVIAAQEQAVCTMKAIHQAGVPAGTKQIGGSLPGTPTPAAPTGGLVARNRSALRR